MIKAHTKGIIAAVWDHDPLLRVNSVAGNIFQDKRLLQRYRLMEAAGACEKLLFSRMELERTKLKYRTDRATEIGILLQPGSRLSHGDVLLADGKFIIVEQRPEKVMSIRIKDKGADKLTLAALVGHAVGNWHRPIAIDGDRILLPIQADSEADAFGKLLPPDLVELRVENEVFEPAAEPQDHEHA